jgi:hypothetical protein
MELSQQLVLFGDKINILEQKVVLKDSIIFNLNSKLFNFNNISLTSIPTIRNISTII